MTDAELPSWAIRVRDERIRRLWSQKTTAVRLRDAADPHTLGRFPPSRAFGDMSAGTKR